MIEDTTPMNPLEALALAIGVSLVLSGAVTLVIFRPLQALLRKVCPSPEAVAFWDRFTILMLFLSPLFISVIWGVAPARILEKEDSGSILQTIVSSALVGIFLAVLGMGFWVSALIRRAPRPTPEQFSRDDRA
jgi:Na+/H+-dicarboxylate symporter